MPPAPVDPTTLGLLRRRAAAVAARRREVERHEDGELVLVVSRAGTRLGLPVAAVVEIRVVTTTRLPRARGRVIAVCPMRGRLCALVDVQRALGLPEELEHGARVTAAILSLSTGEVALRVDEVDGIRTVRAADQDPGHRRSSLPFVRGVTRDLVHLVEPDALVDAASSARPSPQE